MGTENGHSGSMEQAVRAQRAVEGGQWEAATADKSVKAFWARGRRMADASWRGSVWSWD